MGGKKRKRSLKLKMMISSHYIPNHNPANQAGEDAHFFCKRAAVIGVADGVSIDAGEYARQLMKNAASASHLHVSVLNPKKVLKEAYLKTKALGSSTACIVSLAGNKLRAANLGDSGFMVIREGKTVFKLQPHRFNFPYQLGERSRNKPKEAEKMMVKVKRGDVIVVGTDGLFDNLFPDDIERGVKYCFDKKMTLDVSVRALALVARRSSLDGEKVSPFAKTASEAGFEYYGRKYDDITVVTAYII